MEEKLCRDRFGYAVKKLREMRSNKIYTDVTLECQGGCIHAHRCVLMAASPFFYNLLSSNLIGDSFIQIEFESIPVSVIEAIVTSFYGEIQSSLQNDIQLIQKVLETCKHMQEDLLIDYCINSLLNKMTIENCFHLWDLTVKHENCEAEERVLTFILSHLEQILDSYENRFGNLSIDQMEALILFAKEVSLEGESLAHAIISWGKRSPEATLEKIILFFNLLDVFKLSCRFIQKLLNSEFVVNSIELTKFLSSAVERIPTERDIFYKQNLQLHIFYTNHSGDGKVINQTYSIGRREWCFFHTVLLPTYVAKDWLPLVALNGEKFYFSISFEKRFVAYNEKNHQIYTGPAVTLENQVTGVVDGKNMYVWNYEKLVKFDVDTKNWKSLTPIVNVISRSSLLAINGRLFYHASSLSVILMYNFSNNKWECKKSLPDVTHVISIKCKCLRKKCKKKLYFVRGDKQILSYHTESDIWVVKSLPELINSQPLFMNCDEPFILFGDKIDRSVFYIYYPEINLWTSFKSHDFTWQSNGFTCDLSVK